MATARTTLRRHPERALRVPEDAAAILAEAVVAHVGFIDNGQPFVIPLTFLYQDGTIYLHGAPGSRVIKVLAAGEPVCVEVTQVDGLIASKSAETHSINYRSVICFGRGRRLTDEAQRRAVLETMIARYFPGRTAGDDYANITAQESKATWVIAVAVEELSAKGRAGGPRGPFDDDPAAPGNAAIYAPAIGAGPLPST